MSHPRWPHCAATLVVGRFDAAVTTEDGDERLLFAIPGGLCVPCGNLFVAVELWSLLGFTPADRCTSAILSDVDVLERAYAEGWPA